MTTLSAWPLALLIVMPICLTAVENAVDLGTSFADFDRRAKAGEPLNVVFFGASLTWGANATDQAHTSYRAVIADRLAKRYPKAPFHCHDAAIGGTGSQLGAFRVERDVLSRNPDLVFLDFSANDDIGSDDPETLASYEAIVRRLVLEAKVPVVQVVFPFKWNIKQEELAGMKRRTAHRAIADAYGSGWGDAIELVINEVAAGRTTTDTLWNTDPVHPGDLGYQLFADAAWNGFEQAVADHRVGHAPETMINPSTYTTLNRVHLTTLGALPAGWHTSPPHLTALYYDFQMSRWMDELAVASNVIKTKSAKGKMETTAQSVEPLRLVIQASTILLFGEATDTSGHFTISIDGQVISGRREQEKDTDLFNGNRWKTGNGHLVIEVARDLDPTISHVVEITPVFEEGKAEELRIESICVAGGKSTVSLASQKAEKEKAEKAVSLSK